MSNRVKKALVRIRTHKYRRKSAGFALGLSGRSRTTKVGEKALTRTAKMCTQPNSNRQPVSLGTPSFRGSHPLISTGPVQIIRLFAEQLPTAPALPFPKAGRCAFLSTVLILMMPYVFCQVVSNN